MVCGEIECGSQHVGCAVDRRRGKLVGEPISPHSEIARGYEGNTPFCQRVRKMSTHARDIADVAAANPEVTLVYVESLGDGRRIIRHIAVAAMLSHNAGAVLRLPKSEHSLFVGIVMIVGRRDRVGPVSSLAVGKPHYPASGCRVPAIAQTNSYADLHEHRLWCNRQP